jgi:cell division protein FtsQ
VLVSLLGIAGMEIREGDAWRVSEVVVTGNVRVCDAALLHLSDLRDGQRIFEVDLDRAVVGVRRHPWVARAEAHLGFPGAVEIVVEEREPVLLLAMGEMWYVDAAGQPFVRAQTVDLDFPILTGLSAELAAERPELARAVVMGALRILSVVDGHAVAGGQNLSELRFDSRTGYTLVLRNGSELIFGMGDPAPPLRRLDQLIGVGLDLRIPQRVDLDAATVAVATPLGT